MSLRSAILELLQQEDVNFLLTNRLPRRAATRFMGWFSQLRHPLVRDLSIRTWQWFSPLDLSEARKTHFESLHDCFIRELKPGSRPPDPDPAVLVSPCDGIVGASGRIRAGELLQAKGLRYDLDELLGDAQLADRYHDGTYVTLRITAGMYHRFHAPHDCRLRRITYIYGDTWNVNPIALKRVERLFCRNERVVIRAELGAGGQEILLVPVAAILVASIRLHCADVLLHLRYPGPNEIPCDAVVAKGDELGWFQHGSTMIVLAPPEFRLGDNVVEGARLKVGEALLRLP